MKNSLSVKGYHAFWNLGKECLLNSYDTLSKLGATVSMIQRRKFKWQAAKSPFQHHRAVTMRQT